MTDTLVEALVVLGALCFGLLVAVAFWFIADAVKAWWKWRARNEVSE